MTFSRLGFGTRGENCAAGCALNNHYGRTPSPRRFVRIQDEGRLILRFMRRIVPFPRTLPLIAPGVEGGGRGAGGVQFTPSQKGADTLKYGPGKVSGTMGTGQNSYCPIEIRLNKTRACRLVVSPTVFFMAHDRLRQKAHLLRNEGARGDNAPAIVLAFAPHYANYGRFSFVIKAPRLDSARRGATSI